MFDLLLIVLPLIVLVFLPSILSAVYEWDSTDDRTLQDWPDPSDDTRL